MINILLSAADFAMMTPGNVSGDGICFACQDVGDHDFRIFLREQPRLASPMSHAAPVMMATLSLSRMTTPNHVLSDHPMSVGDLQTAQMGRLRALR